MSWQPGDTVDTPCREWQGKRDRAGYGIRTPKTKTRDFKSQFVHRQIIEMVGTDQHGNPLEDGVMHLCDNPACFRYDHLVVGTQADNNADSLAKGRAVGNAEACPQGHPYDETNTYVCPQGWRHCRSCRREYRARYRTNQKKAATS